ncbi:hypothetical protein CAEBREN_08961 [Caenorhabditis brenneri]|uniref:Uncharacterized protein n=1 Tax=Caenorhabditis brenneri TaxID=135651 RepID=G0MWU5_CAEBE|nr:hypothetical protein CAEBREN_08961 [Caenorhabditis brenneri]
MYVCRRRKGGPIE